MTTDGRPERRPWWDHRDDHDGLAIPLPQSLGGDAITASGLLYDNEGNWRYVRDNDGLRQWPKTRKRLNNTLDQLERLIDPSRQLQVESIGLGMTWGSTTKPFPPTLRNQNLRQQRQRLDLRVLSQLRLAELSGLRPQVFCFWPILGSVPAISR